MADSLDDLDFPHIANQMFESGTVERRTPSPEWLGSAKPHKCPVCDGAGVVAYPPGTPAYQPFSSSSSAPWPCHACQETGVIWG